MSFERPTLNALIERITGDVESRLPGTSARLAKNLLTILVRMEAGASHELYGALDWLSTHLLPTTDDADVLAQWAGIYGVPRLDAVAATGTIALTGSGAVVAGTRLMGPNQVEYQTVDGVSAPADVAIEAVNLGVDTNLAAGVKLTLLTAIAGVDNQAQVTNGGLTGGADREQVSDWRERILQRIQNPPQGGSKSDYERWAKEAHPAVTNVWVLPTTPQPGQVTLYIMTYGATPTGTPEAGVLAAVDAHIQQERPVAAQVFVFAPATKTVDLIIQLDPNTPEVQDAVKGGLADLFEREAAPGQPIPLSHLNETVSEAQGEYDHIITGTTQADLTPTAGHILMLGAVTFEVLGNG